MVGVAPECDIYVCRVLDENGSGSFSDIMDALDWCVANGMDVINMSLGSGVDFQGFYTKIRTVYDAKIPIVCAAGNSAWETGYLSFPAVYNETIAIASLNQTLTKSSFSSVGGNIDVAAPGENILSCSPGNTYRLLSGTSMATPFVTGLVALIISKHRTLGGSTPINGPEDIREHLNKTATDLDFSGRDNYTGYGIINPLSSLNYEVSSTISNVSNVTKTSRGTTNYFKIKYKPSEDLTYTTTTTVAVPKSNNIKKGAIITSKTKRGATYITTTQTTVITKANVEQEITIPDSVLYNLVKSS
jgi:subtilisin family serine protease